MSATQPLKFDRCRKRLQKQSKYLIFSGPGASTEDRSPEVGKGLPISLGRGVPCRQRPEPGLSTVELGSA
jgi:hypothetical protein